MLHFLRKFTRNASGSVGALAALATPVLIGAGVMGTEVAFWAVKHRSMQSATDAAALSAVVSGYLSAPLAAQAEAVAASRGYVPGKFGVVGQVHSPPVSGPYAGKANAVEVLLQQPQTPVLAGFLSREQVISAPDLSRSGSLVELACWRSIHLQEVRLR